MSGSERAEPAGADEAGARLGGEPATASADDIRLLYDIAMLVSGAQRRDEALEAVLSTICHARGWAFGQAWIGAGDRSSLVPGPAWHLPSAALEAFRRAAPRLAIDSGGPVARTWRRRAPLLVEDVGADPAYTRADPARAAGLRTCVLCPVDAGPEPVVLEFYPGPGAVPRGDVLRFLGTMAAHLGAMLRNQHAVEALAESEERYRAVSELMSDIAYAFVIDDEQKVHWRWLTGPFTSLTGYLVEEWEDIGGWETVIYPEDSRMMRGRLEALLAGESDVREFRIVRKDGEVRWLRVHARPVTGPDGSLIVYGAASDITEAKLLEVERARYAEELRRSNRDLEQFAAVASHDLQEPLRMVTAYLELLERRLGARLAEDEREFLGYAVDGARRMRAMIQDLLTYARVGSAPVHPERFLPSEAAAAAADLLRLAVEEAKGRVRIGDLPPVRADREQVTLVLQNLLANALTYRSERPPVVVVEGRREGEEVVVAVRDNGIGIAPEHAERIFGIFQRLHGRERYPGTGIGLAICKRVVERHGGRIWVESRPGAGATFRFTLPAADGEG